MVSSELKKRLEAELKDLSTTSIDLEDYKGELLNVAFDIYNSDTFIAGIADKILSGDIITKGDKNILAIPLIVDNTFWVKNNGQTIDLKNSRQLLTLAEKIENLRKICRNLILLISN